MSRSIPRVLAMHDLSGFGRCALSVVIPVMSALGVQVCPVPTAALSTHTGGFTGFSFVDMTDFMGRTLAHYRSLSLSFDGIYSGFLGNEAQCAVVEESIDSFGGGLVLVDPVLGDNGTLYETVTRGLVDNMRRLVSRADWITPNVTEAAYLLEESPDRVLTEEQAVSWGKRLCGLGPDFCVLTGVHRAGMDGQVFSLLYEGKSGRHFFYGSREVYGEYPGAGDAFSSVLLGCLLRGMSREQSMIRASDFVFKSISLAREQGEPPRDGLPIEALLPGLYQ